MLLLLCVVFFSAIQHGEEIELTILRSFFILSGICLKRDGHLVYSELQQNCKSCFWIPLEKEWGVKPRGTIASSLWGTSGWFAYVWTLPPSLNVYVSVITLFVWTHNCLPIFLSRYVWWVILGINQSFHLSSLVYWRDCSIIFSAPSFISDPGQIDVTVRIYAHFLVAVFLPFPEVYQDILRKHTSTLVKDLEPEKLMLHLDQMDIIDENNGPKIRSRKTRTGMNEALLTTLTKRGPKAFRTLVEGLQKFQPSLARILLQEGTWHLMKGHPLVLMHCWSCR